MKKFAFFIVSTSIMLAPVPAFAEVDTISGIGESRLDACKDAKDTAQRVTSQNGFVLDSFGVCDCEQRTENLWKCIVEYSFHLRKDGE